MKYKANYDYGSFAVKILQEFDGTAIKSFKIEGHPVGCHKTTGSAGKCITTLTISVKNEKNFKEVLQRLRKQKCLTGVLARMLKPVFLF